MPVTLKHIAMDTGLSLPTVSHVLRGRGTFSPSTRQRVHEAAARLGYRPNSSARSMRAGRLGQIAMLTRSGLGPIQLNLNKGAYTAAAKRDLHLAYAEIDFDRLEDQDYAPKVLAELCADGFLVHYAWQIPESSINHIRGYGLPVVWINTDGAEDCVYPDDHQGAQLATEQLLQRGHRRLLYLDQETRFRHPAHYSTHARRAGYSQAMQAAGLTPICHTAQGMAASVTEAIASWRQVLQAHPQTTAILCQHMRIATPLVAAAASLGLEIPRDLSLITFSDLGDAPFDNGLSLSTLELPMWDVGLHAVDMLQSKFTQSIPIKSIAVPYQPPPDHTIRTPDLPPQK